jgi:hypothetical protein
MINLINRPNPGSDLAVKQGCLCARMDNEYGRGYHGSGDFVVRLDCPVHNISVEEFRKNNTSR